MKYNNIKKLSYLYKRAVDYNALMQQANAELTSIASKYKGQYKINPTVTDTGLNYEITGVVLYPEDLELFKSAVFSSNIFNRNNTVINVSVYRDAAGNTLVKQVGESYASKSKKLKKKASVEAAEQFFNNYERLSDAIDDLKSGLAAWYAEGLEHIGGEYKDKYVDLTEKAHQSFSSALDNVVKDIVPLEDEMDISFSSYFENSDDSDLERKLIEAFKTVDDGDNYVKLSDWRKAAGLSRTEFDSTLYKLRRDMIISLDAADGRYERPSAEELNAGIEEGGQTLVYAQMR